MFAVDTKLRPGFALISRALEKRWGFLSLFCDDLVLYEARKCTGGSMMRILHVPAHVLFSALIRFVYFLSRSELPTVFLPSCHVLSRLAEPTRDLLGLGCLRRAERRYMYIHTTITFASVCECAPDLSPPPSPPLLLFAPSEEEHRHRQTGPSC